MSILSFGFTLTNQPANIIRVTKESDEQERFHSDALEDAEDVTY